MRLDITDGDKVHFSPYWSIDPTQTIDAMMQITEHLNLTKSPAWYQEIRSIVLFDKTEGGALPSTIERVAAYTPLVSTGFDGNLTPSVNNLQALAQAVDDMTLGAAPATTAADDFQVGNGSGNWIKKTLAQTKTILGIFADAASDSVYYVRRNATWTNAKTYFDTIYASLSHTHIAAARVSHSTTQSIANATFQALTFDTETYDTDAMHDTGTNPTRLTCKVAGKYIVTSCVAFNTNTTGARICAFRLNGSATNLNQQRAAPIATYQTILTICDIYDMAVNDYVEVFAFQDSGAALDVISASTSLAMARLA